MKYCRITLLALATTFGVHAAPLDLANTPLFIGGSDTALLQLVMQRDNKLFFEAYPTYEDINRDGVLDIGYKPEEIDYVGYFDSYLCYESVSNSHMQPIATNADKKCVSGWSGDFLNFLTMTRMDVIRSALYGGKRLTDTTTSTILRRAFVPPDYHAWGVEYNSPSIDNYDITEYSPLDQPTTGARHLLVSNNKDFDDIPYLRVRLNSSQRIYHWVEKNGAQGDGTADLDMVVDVEVCKSGFPQSGCHQYPNGSMKPTGVLHEFGADESMYFSLLTGSYENNLRGGVLRNTMSAFSGEIDPNTGQFTNEDGLVSSVDAIQIINNYSGTTQSDCGRINSRPMENGECSAWGNPLAEMMYEGLRYLGGQGSPTAIFHTTGGRDAALGLPAPTWDDPYSQDQPYPTCSTASQLVISDPSPSFDGDDLPGGYFGNFTDSSLGTLDVGGLADFISSNEPGVTGMKLIGQVGSQADGAPSPKSVSSLRNIRGLAPEEPHRQGSYYASSVAYYGLKNDIHPSADGEQKVSSYAMSIGSPVPTIDVDVQGTTVSFAPFARTIGDANGPWAHAYARTNAIVGFTIVELTPTSGTYRVAFDDEEQGADNDMDAIATYSYSVVDNTIEMTVDSTAASGNYIQHIGYSTLGTTTDGVYLVVRDLDTAVDNDLDYLLDVPPGQSPGIGWNDFSPLPTNSIRTFTADSSFSSQQLEPPLWYAAKWGGFDDLNADGIAQQDEWDKNNDGLPDNYFSVSNPGEMHETLREMFGQITEQAGSGASVAVTGGALNSGDRIYQSSFVSGKWQGELTAYPITEDGTVSTNADWSANANIQQQILNDSREIITLNRDSNNGVAFQWPDTPQSPTAIELSLTQVLDLSRHPTTSIIDALGEQRLHYIRGNTVDGFRPREQPLGDIVHSSPLVVGPPSYYYPDDWASGPESGYSAFRVANKNRRRVVYVGANDGMLHAFDAGSFNNTTFEWSAGSGQEMFAYIPNQVFNHLPDLTEENYRHKYYVDATPRAGDAFINGEWSTVLASGLRGGGQGVFALDITNPDTISEVNADQLTLWEYSDLDDPDMGYSFASPLIVRMHNNSWAAVFGNGYNSTQGDDNISSSGQSALFIVDLETGALVKKFLTGAGSVTDPNGMSEPTAVDLDFDNIIDYIYAGDLHGNVWGFDVSASSTSSWNLVGNAARYTALDASGNRTPITTPIAVGSHPSSAGVMLFWGTGKYLEKADVQPSGNVNRVYGLWDQYPFQTATFAATDLLEQSITGESTVDVDTDNNGITDTTFQTRQGSQHAVDWNTHKGWLLDLQYGAYTGEQVVASPILREGRVIFNTHVPSGNVCESGETGWLLALDAASGAMPSSSPFDLDGDGQFAEPPLISVKGIGSPITTPTIAAAHYDDLIISSGGDGAEVNTTTLDAKFRDGRLTWRELEP